MGAAADQNGFSRDDNRMTVAAGASVTLNRRLVSLDDLRARDGVAVTFHEGARGRAIAAGIAAIRRP